MASNMASTPGAEVFDHAGRFPVPRYYSCSIRIAYKILQIICYNENASRAFDYMIINGLILKIISVRYKMFFQVRLYWYLRVVA